jgi:hypothetical protein
MNAGDSYRSFAAQLSAKAKGEKSISMAFELESLAMSYRRLAEQADRNSLQDIAAEFGPPPRLDGGDKAH